MAAAERIAAQTSLQILWRTPTETSRSAIAVRRPHTLAYVVLLARCVPPASRRSACYRFDADSTSWKERGTTTAMPGDRHAQTDQRPTRLARTVHAGAGMQNAATMHRNVTTTIDPHRQQRSSAGASCLTAAAAIALRSPFLSAICFSGRGDVKLLQNKDTKLVRVLLRQEKTLKLCMNHKGQTTQRRSSTASACCRRCPSLSPIS